MESLHTLGASWNEKITDDGIEHLNLCNLYASYNSKISYRIEDGIVRNLIKDWHNKC